jgi:hypothetical protein
MTGPCVFPAFTALGAFLGLGDRDLRVISGVLRFSGEPSALPLLVRMPASYPVVGGVCGLIKRSNVCEQQVSISTYIKGAQGTNWLCDIVSVVLRGLIYRRVAILVLEKIRYPFHLNTSGAATWEVLTISGSLVGMGADLIERGGACFSKPATCCWTATKPKSPSFDIGGDGGRSATTAVVIFGCVSKLEGKEFSLLVEWMAFDGRLVQAL